MKSLLIVVGILALNFTTCQGQTLSNPSFEDQGSAPDLAANWNRWGNWFNRETAWSPTHGGTAMMGYHHWQIEDASNSGIWQEVQNAKEGQNYLFSIWIWKDASDKGNDAVSVELRLESTVNDAQATVSSNVVAVKDIPAGKWTQFQVKGRAPNKTLRVLIAVTPNASTPREGALKFDDASLEGPSDSPSSTHAATSSSP